MKTFITKFKKPKTTSVVGNEGEELRRVTTWFINAADKAQAEKDAREFLTHNDEFGEFIGVFDALTVDSSKKIRGDESLLHEMDVNSADEITISETKTTTYSRAEVEASVFLSPDVITHVFDASIGQWIRREI